MACMHASTITSHFIAVVLQRALAEGSVDMKIVKSLIQGPARVGKTHVKALIMKKKLEEGNSPSTNCVEPAVRAVCTEKFAEDDESWKEVSAEEMMKMLTEEIKHQKKHQHQKKKKNQHQQMSAPQATPQTESSHGQKGFTIGHVTLTQPKPEEIGADSEVKIYLEKLQSLVSTCKGVQMQQKWIYFIDSGGQPQFHNFFQAFIQNTSILLLVFSLAEKLSEVNKHQFQDQAGCEISVFEGITAPKVKDVLKSISSTLYSNDPEEERKIFLVGTFKDLYKENPQGMETIEEKEKALGELFKEEEVQATASHSTRTRIIFPVNGLQAESGEFDDKVVSELRKQIHCHLDKTKTLQIPLRWFALELALERKAASVDRKVLTYEECLKVAAVLHFKVRELHVALNFLHGFSLLLFFPELELVFTDPQALLTVFSSILVNFYHEKFSGSIAELNSYKKAILSSHVLKKLLNSSLELGAVLTYEKLLRIFQSLLIAANVDEDKYFIPALLPSLDDDTRGKALSVESPTVPLVFLFADKCTPCGLFCAVVVKLLSGDWEVDMKADTYSNAVTLLHKKYKPKLAITFIDSFKHFEFRCSNEDMLPEIRKEMEEVVRTVIDCRKYCCKAPQIAFYCSCSKCKFASIVETGDICCDCVTYSLEDTKRERKWMDYRGKIILLCTYVH